MSGHRSARFDGEESGHSAGLLYHRNRYYDPQLGRFISEDPIRLAGGINLYAYAGNNPVNFTDPFGLCVGNNVAVEGGSEVCMLEEIVVRSRPDDGRESGTARNPSSRGSDWPRGSGDGGGGRGKGKGKKGSGEGVETVEAFDERMRMRDLCSTQIGLAAANAGLDLVGVGLMYRAASQGVRLYRAGVGLDLVWGVAGTKVAHAMTPGFLPASIQVTGTAGGHTGSFNSLDALKFAGGMLPVIGTGIAVRDAVQICRGV